MTALTVREEADIEGEWVSGDGVLLNLILIMERQTFFKKKNMKSNLKKRNHFSFVSVTFEQLFIDSILQHQNENNTQFRVCFGRI